MCTTNKTKPPQATIASSEIPNYTVNSELNQETSRTDSSRRSCCCSNKDISSSHGKKEAVGQTAPQTKVLEKREEVGSSSWPTTAAAAHKKEILAQFPPPPSLTHWAGGKEQQSAWQRNPRCYSSPPKRERSLRLQTIAPFQRVRGIRKQLLGRGLTLLSGLTDLAGFV